MFTDNWLTPCTPNLCNRLSIYTYGMGVGPAWGVMVKVGRPLGRPN